MLQSIATMAAEENAKKKAMASNVLEHVFRPKLGSNNEFWLNQGAARAQQEKEERARLARNTKQLLDRERRFNRRQDAAAKIQAHARGVLVRNNTIHRHTHHHKVWRNWSVRKVFDFYVQRQCEVESNKERSFQNQLNKYIKERSAIKDATASQLSKKLDESRISRDELGPILDFDAGSLFRAKMLYLKKHVIAEAERECQEEGFSFRECLLSYLKHGPQYDIFHYHSKALSFPYFLILLRDCCLLDNSTSLVWLQECYTQRSVSAPARNSRIEVSAMCAYREYIATRVYEEQQFQFKGRSKYKDPLQPTPEELYKLIKDKLGCNRDLSAEIVTLYEENPMAKQTQVDRRNSSTGRRKSLNTTPKGGINEMIFAQFCIDNDILGNMNIDETTRLEIAEEAKTSASGTTGTPENDNSAIVSQIKIILNQHSSLALRFAGFEDALMHLAKLQNKSRKERDLKKQGGSVAVINSYRGRTWHDMYGNSDEDEELSSSDDEESPADVQARYHLEDTIVRVHLAPTMNAINRTAVCGATSSLGKCFLQSNRYLGYILRYERNLRSVYIYYSTQAWLRDLNKRKKWSDVIAENFQLSYVDFVRFCNEFNLYPQLLTNDMNSNTGFQLLDVYLGAKQGTRADPGHNCYFSLHNRPGNDPFHGHTKTMYCAKCGAQEYHFPSKLIIKISKTVEATLLDKEQLVDRNFWKTPLATRIKHLMTMIGDDPTDAEVFYATREAREPFEQLRVVCRSLVHAEKDETLRIDKEARVEREKKAKQEELIASIKEEEEHKRKAELKRIRDAELGVVVDPWSDKNESMNNKDNDLNSKKSKRKKNKRRKKDKDKEMDEKKGKKVKQAEDAATTTNIDGSNKEPKDIKEEKIAGVPATKVRLEKLKKKLIAVSNDLQHNILAGLARARELKVRIRSTRLSFPEFTHCLVLCAQAAFAQFSDEHHDWEEPMRELFRRMDPSFAAKFGRKIEVETKDRVKTDRDLKTYIQTFHNQLKRLFIHYEYATKSFNTIPSLHNQTPTDETCLSPSAFFLLVQDMRLCKAVSQDGVMAAYEAATAKSPGNMMTSDIFVVAMEALLYQDFVETGRAGNNPLAWIAHISRATTMTPRGLVIRKGVAKLATLFGLYGPTSRTTTIKPGAYAQVFQHAKQNKKRTKAELESVAKLSVCYNKAALALIDDDDERVYEATDRLKHVVASLRSVKSYWKILQTRHSKKGAINAVANVNKKNEQVAATDAEAVHTSTQPNLTLPTPNTPTAAPLYGQVSKTIARMHNAQNSILTRKTNYYASMPDPLNYGNTSSTGKNDMKEDQHRLLSTNSNLFKLTQVQSTMDKHLFDELSPKKPKRPSKFRTTASDSYLSSIRRNVERQQKTRLSNSVKVRKTTSMVRKIAQQTRLASQHLAQDEHQEVDVVGHILACVKRGLTLKSQKDFGNAKTEFHKALEHVDRMVRETKKGHVKSTAKLNKSTPNLSTPNLLDNNMEEDGEETGSKRQNQLMVVILSALCQTSAACKNSDQALAYGNRALRICRAMADLKSTISVLGTMGNCHASMNNIAEAVQVHKEQMHVAHRSGNQMNEIPCYADLARSYALVQDYDQAIRQSTHRLQLAKKSNHQFEIALALNDLGKLQLKCGSFKRGLKNLVQCVHLHKSDSVHQAAAAIEIGHVYCRTYGEHDKALHYYTFGLKSAKKCHDSKSAQAEALGGIAECKMGLAAILARQTRNGYADPVVVQLRQEATVRFAEKKELSLVLGQLDKACRTDLQLGLLWQSTGENEKALDAFSNSVVLAEKLGSKEILLDTLVEYGQHCLKTLHNGGNKGHAQLQRAVQYAKELHRPDVLCEVLQILGRDCFAHGNHETALKQAKEAALIASHNNDSARLSGAMCLQGMCHLHYQEYGAAVMCFKKQLRATIDTGDRVGQTQALDGLTECYTRSDECEKAAEVSEQCIALMKSMEDVAGEIVMCFKHGMILYRLKFYKDAVVNYKRIIALAERTADVEAGQNASLCLTRVMGLL